MQIDDTGANGVDTLTMHGTSENDSLNKQSGSVEWRLTGESVYRERVEFDGIDGLITLNAQAGNDTVIDPNSGNFLILGGPGDDTIIIQDTTGAVTADGGSGNNTIIIIMGQLAGQITVNGADGTNIVNVIAPSGNNTLTLSATQRPGPAR